MNLHRFIKEAMRWQIVRRSLLISLVVGTMLVGINHCNCLMNGCFSSMCAVQCGFTFLVPYFVSTVSAVLAQADNNQLSVDSMDEDSASAKRETGLKTG